MILLSIVVPVYNTAQWLPACLDSLLTSSRQDYEVIVVNDASTDNSLDLAEHCQSLHGNVRVVTMSANGGLCAVRNRGIAEASGKYVMFVDSDDFLSPKSIDEILSVLTSHDVDIIRFRLRRVTEEGKTISVVGRNITGKYELPQSPDFNPAVVHLVFDIFGLSSMGGNTIFRRILLNGMSYDAKYLPSEDRVFGTNFFLKARSFYVADSTWYNYVQHPSGLSKNYTPAHVKSLLNIQLHLLMTIREWPWFPMIKRDAFSRVLTVYLGWNYDLVFRQNPDVPDLKQYYFETLRRILLLGKMEKMSPLRLTIIGFCARKDRAYMLSFYRIPARIKGSAIRKLQKAYSFFRRKR